MVAQAASIVGAGAATTGLLALGAAALVAAKVATKLTNSHIRMTEEFVKARKVYQIGAAYGMGLAPTGLAGAQAALATTGAAGMGGIARSVEETRTRRAERFQSTGEGVAGREFTAGLGAAPKGVWEWFKERGRSLQHDVGRVVNWTAGVRGADVAAGAENLRKASFEEDVKARRERLLLEKAFPMLQHEYARGTAVEGMAGGAGAVAMATPSNPMHRELVAKIDEAIDSINRLGRLP